MIVDEQDAHGINQCPPPPPRASSPHLGPAAEAVKRPLAYLEGAVSDDWLDGAFAVGDIALASAFRTLGYAGWNLDAAAYPRLAAWYGRVQSRAGWKAAVEVEDKVLAAAMGG